MGFPGQESAVSARMSVEQAIDLVDGWVTQHTGRHLSDVQIAVFREAWLGSRKTYSQLAEETQYSESYIQQGIGPKLWRLLSEITGEKVTKRTVKTALATYVSTLDTDSAKHSELDTCYCHAYVETAQTNSVAVAQAPQFPEGSVALKSAFYVDRGRQEKLCYQTIHHAGCLIRIKAPRQMGKSSLVNRILAQAQATDFQVVLLNFQQAEASILSDTNRLLRWVCANLAMKLGVNVSLDNYWDEDLGSKMSCNLFLQAGILGQQQSPVLVAFEEVHTLLEYPQAAQEFLTLVRFWHERAKVEADWRSLRLIMVHSTEIYFDLDVNQSPLNVGLSVSLFPFNLEQVSDLAQRYGLSLSEEMLARLHQLTGGHPHLTQLALYHLAVDDLTFEEWLATAATDVGIYQKHLHKYALHLKQVPSLEQAFYKILSASAPIEIDQIDGFKLQSLGLINLTREGAVVSCELYQQYFGTRIEKE